MNNRQKHTYHEYKELFADLLQHDEIGEQTKRFSSPLRLKDERLAHCIWFEKMLRLDNLITCKGTPLTIIHPGRWNQEAGPDFLQAEIAIGNKRLKGDVEIHYDASDWEHHGHAKDPRYRNVILHAFMDNTDRKSSDKAYSAAPLERFNMSEYVFPDIETIKRSLSLEDYPYGTTSGRGRCASIWTKVEVDMITDFFDLAGRERMLAKMTRLADCLVGENLDQVFYQALMTTMGYKGAKSLFFLLAKRTPLLDIIRYSTSVEEAERPTFIQSILLHVANLVPDKDDVPNSPDTATYLEKIRGYWREYAPFFSDRIIPLTRQWYVNVRPDNFPPRRIAGLSHLICRCSANDATPLFYFADLFKKHSSIGSEKHLKDLLRFIQMLLVIDDKEDYWSRHCSFQSKCWERHHNLIGEGRALSMLFNAVLPTMLLYARQANENDIESLCWRLFDIFPCLPENVITRFMQYRLFEDQRLVGSLMTNECRQQALFQIFYDCCNNNEVSCEDCFFLRRFEYMAEDAADE